MGTGFFGVAGAEQATLGTRNSVIRRKERCMTGTLYEVRREAPI